MKKNTLNTNNKCQWTTTTATTTTTTTTANITSATFPYQIALDLRGIQI